MSDVNPAEHEFLDCLRQSNGLLTMSSGYQEGKGDYKHFVVMDGSLKIYSDKIVDVDKHNRKAFLGFELNGRRCTSGI